MKVTENKNPGVVEQLKETVLKKIYEKPKKVSEEESVASKSACGWHTTCGALVQKC